MSAAQTRFGWTLASSPTDERIAQLELRIGRLEQRVALGERTLEILWMLSRHHFAHVGGEDELGPYHVGDE